MTPVGVTTRRQVVSSRVRRARIVVSQDVGELRFNLGPLDRGQPVGLLRGIVTFEGSFGDVLPWLARGRRVIGVELQGHGHTPDTGRAMSIERFADDVAELVARVAGGGPVDVWGFSLGALTATSLALRYPAKVRRLVLAASNVRPDGYHPEITAPEQDDPRLPTEEEFATWQVDYESVAPNPADFFPFLERRQPVVHGLP